MRQVAEAQFKDPILCNCTEGLRTSHDYHILNRASFSLFNIRSGPSILGSHGFDMRIIDAKAYRCNVSHVAFKKILQSNNLDSREQCTGEL